jgi:hypothetical protein
MLREEIIQQVNEAHGGPRFAFPHFSLWYPVDARLSVYRTYSAWALVVEAFAFDDYGKEGHLACETKIFCYGSDIPQAPGVAGPSLYITGDGPSGKLFDPKDVTQQLISPKVADMTLREKVIPVTTNPAEYAAVGIDLKRPPRILGYELLRLVAPSHHRLLFAVESEIIERIGEPMPLLLRLDEWRHPDRDKGETPADSESFQMIADVITHNDPSLYRPTEPPNTHWRNWPMAGMM